MKIATVATVLACLVAAPAIAKSVSAETKADLIMSVFIHGIQCKTKHSDNIDRFFEEKRRALSKEESEAATDRVLAQIKEMNPGPWCRMVTAGITSLEKMAEE